MRMLTVVAWAVWAVWTSKASMISPMASLLRRSRMLEYASRLAPSLVKILFALPNRIRILKRPEKSGLFLCLLAL